MVLDSLIQLISEKKVIPVLGPDLLSLRASDGSLRPLYGVLAQRLADRLGVSGGELPVGSELNTIASRHLENRGDMEDVYINLKAVMTDLDQIEPPEPLMKLAAIDTFPLYVTTTFDNFLPIAIDKARFQGESRTRVFAYSRNAVDDLPEDWRNSSAPVVFHLFGKASSIPEYVVTQEDTLEFVRALLSEKTMAKRLFSELYRSNILIIGCGFPDWLARFFVRLVKNDRLILAGGKTDFIVDSKAVCEPDLKLFFERFSRRTKIISMDGAAFIDELHQRWIQLYPVAGGPADSAGEANETGSSIEPGAVFLSYASEDLEPAEKIKRCLEHEGMDVFFDKQALKTGDDYEQKIIRHIEGCSVFIPLVSQSTLTSKRRFFRIEWNVALDEEKRSSWADNFILPVSIDGTHPTEDALPPRFRELHWTDLPGGVCPETFVLHVRELYRRYHKACARKV